MTSDVLECLIPARGGSKRFPRKNIALLGGRPFLGWVVVAAREAGVFSDVWVSTDDAEIATIARDHGARVHDRPRALGADDATIAHVALDFAERRAEAGTASDYLGIV